MVAENDPDGQVRKTARDSIELIKKKREIIDAENEDEASKFVSESTFNGETNTRILKCNCSLFSFQQLDKVHSNRLPLLPYQRTK